MTSSEAPTVEKLASQAAGGDREATETLLRLLEPTLKKTASAELKSREEACYAVDDAVNELRLHIVMALSAYDSAKGSFEVWARSVGKRFVRDRLRFLNRRKRKPAGGQTSLDGNSKDGSDRLLEWLTAQLPPPDRRLSREEAGLALSAALMSLSDDEREAVHLRYYQSASIEDISKAVGRTIPGVHNLLLRAKRKLLSCLGSASRYLSSR